VLTWNSAPAAPGIYLAVVRYGNVEKKLKIAVVK
jgi:hypothetical protein